VGSSLFAECLQRLPAGRGPCPVGRRGRILSYTKKILPYLSNKISLTRTLVTGCARVGVAPKTAPTPARPRRPTGHGPRPAGSLCKHSANKDEPTPSSPLEHSHCSTNTKCKRPQNTRDSQQDKHITATAPPHTPYTRTHHIRFSHQRVHDGSLHHALHRVC
jgi:hypothetical protein